MLEVCKKTVSIIGVPMDLGAGRRGVDMGPSAIRCARVQEKLESLGYHVVDRGNLVVREPRLEERTDERLKHLHEIRRVNTRLAALVSQTIREGELPLVLGGDHSIAIGTIKGLLEHVPRPGVIWFDAHVDANTADTTPSGNIHGMSLAVCLGYGDPRLTGIRQCGRTLQPGNVVIIGARSIDPGERLLLRELGVTVFTMHDLDRKGMGRIMEETLERLSGTDGIHLSYDMDSLDPNESPGVGTPVPGGITYREGHLAMEMLSASGMLISAEFVEVNPVLDLANKTALAAVEMIGSVFGEQI
ncbi:arginase [Paenibacillus massiliensis]|uniref:arginase n=1 Tax=Paenibacillus massiliensis TaxID=225917 RepID=UPI000567BDEC|nr:arginase [Paenibacillus massiliensis]